jgi:NAD(P)-dependent dehydrogenase (short-subunit alcohol dehydrogenase family)
MLSQMQAHLDEAGRERVLGYNVLGRFAELREVALATLFAASPYASFVTGTTIDVTASVP